MTTSSWRLSNDYEHVANDIALQEMFTYSTVTHSNDPCQVIIVNKGQITLRRPLLLLR